jgi:UTP--glucose-1-phosphate uridylyltransferase
MSVTKSVIPAAGFGTRMLPAAKAVPKEMLPVLDRPAIQHIVEEASEAGARQVLLVTSRDKRAIEDHFDLHPELEARLTAAGRADLLASIASLLQRVTIHAVRQRQQRGLGHAVLQARYFVGNEPFLCLLGDAVFSAAPGVPLPSAELIEAHRELGGSIIALEEVPVDKVNRYGIAGGKTVRDRVLKLDTLVEKPSIETAPSRFAIAARYVLSPAVFAALDRTPPGKGDEIQLTDALKLMLDAGEVIHGIVLKARRHDIGNPLDWLKTNLVFAKHDAALWKQIAPVMKEMIGGD